MRNYFLGINLLFSLIATSINNPIPTIILINGEAQLVYLDDEYIVEVIQAVPYYFSSSLTHEEIVAGLIEQKEKAGKYYASNEDRFIPKEEVNVLDNAEFIRFISQKALLDNIAVNRIRKIANDYAEGGISTINLNVLHMSTSSSEQLADNRLKSVKDLLVAFGVDELAIVLKKDLGENLDNNPFIRISYQRE